MPRPRPPEKLVRVSIRLPESVLEEFTGQAQSHGKSISDVMRSHIKIDEVKQIGISSRRPMRLKPPSNVDPVYLGELRRIGNNLNQIARAINQLDGPFEISTAEILLVINAMREEIFHQGESK